MHCGAEVTESSTNKQHHLSERRGKERGREDWIDGRGGREGGREGGRLYSYLQWWPKRGSSS
jgi:hypothetical protein